MTTYPNGAAIARVYMDLNFGNVAPGAPVTVTGTVTNGSTAVSGLSTALSLTAGALISGTGLPPVDFIANNTTASTSLALTAAATASATTTLTISNLPIFGPELIGTPTLTAGSAYQSTFWNSNGVYRRGLDLNHAEFGDLEGIFLNAGTIGSGALVSGWWLSTSDGVNYETVAVTASSTVQAMARAPDFQISIAGTYSVGGRFRAPFIQLMSEDSKMILQTNAAIPNFALKIIPKADGS